MWRHRKGKTWLINSIRNPRKRAGGWAKSSYPALPLGRLTPNPGRSSGRKPQEARFPPLTANDVGRQGEPCDV